MRVAPRTEYAEAAAPAVIVAELVRRYGELTAVDGISFEVRGGEVFGIVGPNGAGKTTTLEIMEGLRRPDSGGVTVLGIDVLQEPRRVKARIGVQLQAAALIFNLTVRETLEMFSGLYPKQLDREKLIERFGLEDKRDDRVGNLSGGQRQRLSVALALVNDPELVILDEPTTGLDPAARRALWDYIRGLRGEGRTVILTTHYMEEAESLCDRVAIMDHGRIIALDTPAKLVRALEYDRTIECQFTPAPDTGLLESLPGVSGQREVDGQYLLNTLQPTDTLRAILDLEKEGSLKVEDVKVRSATLEDVFIELTGRRVRD